MPDATRCYVIPDVEGSGYLCSWEYDIGSTDAHDAYAGFVEQARSCVDDAATEHTDQSVNHPDYWESVYFTTDDTEVSVSLKNKNALRKTLVAVGVDNVTTAVSG